MSDTHDPRDPELVTEIAPYNDSTGLEARTRGEIDIQIVTARRFPRSIRQFMNTALEAATLDEETAGACFYALPRDGKTVEGPSARLAEIVASAWGHLRVEARVVGEDDRFVTSRAVAWDMQNNVAYGFEVRRRITNRQGKKFNDDMVSVTANAASSIALRNAVFKTVPSPFWRPIYNQCRVVAVGDAKTLVDRRHAMMQSFAKMGVQPARIFALIGVPGEEDITLDHLATLRGLFTAIKDGETTIDEAFPEPQKPGTKSLSGLTEQLATKQNGAAPPPQATDSKPADAAPTPHTPAPEMDEADAKALDAEIAAAEQAPKPTTPEPRRGGRGRLIE